MMHQDHEHVEDSERRGRHDEEVDRDEVGEVILEKRAPSLRGWLRATRHESGNATLRDVEPELEQLAVNAWRTPERIRKRHGAHEIRKLRGDGTSRSRRRGSPAGASESQCPAERCAAPLATQPIAWRATPRGGDRGGRIVVAWIRGGAGRVVAGVPGFRG